MGANEDSVDAEAGDGCAVLDVGARVCGWRMRNVSTSWSFARRRLKDAREAGRRVSALFAAE